MDKTKIYILHYTCGDILRVTCYNKACDLCNQLHPLYYEEKYVDKDELYNLINIYNSEHGNFIHISNVIPDGWESKEQFYNINKVI